MMNNITVEMTTMVREFMTNFEQPIYPDVDHLPCETALLRSALIMEEAVEYSRAARRTEDELDGICDLLYVVIGTNITMSIPVLPVQATKIIPMAQKPSIWYQVLSVTQDLDCKFPCEKIQKRELNKLISLLVDIGVNYGYKLQEAFAEVHRSNMTKLWETPPKAEAGLIIKPKGGLFLVKRKDGKVVKPPTFVPPNLMPYL